MGVIFMEKMYKIVQKMNDKCILCNPYLYEVAIANPFFTHR